MMATPTEADLARLQMVQELELEMMADMYKRMANACHKKCIAPVYHEADISKGEGVCLDRCVAKYLEIHERVGKKLSAISTQEESAMKQVQADPSQMKLPG